MTLIIGAKFKDGVILVSDRKITCGDGLPQEFDNKLIIPFDIPLVFGAAGYKNKFDQFNRKIMEKVQERLREIDLKNRAYLKARGLEYPEKTHGNVEVKKFSSKDIETTMIQDNSKKSDIKSLYEYTHEMFLEDCCDLIYQLCIGRDGLSKFDLDVLLIRFSRKEPTLHQINWLGDEQELKFCAIGSGSEYVNKFLREFCKEDMSIEEILKLAYFCIYYVQDLEFDLGVGIEKDKLPDHQIILKDGRIGTFTGFDGNKESVISEIREKIKKFKEVIDTLKFT